MNKPSHFFGFLIALGAVVVALSVVIPNGTKEIGPFEVGYYQPKDLLGPFWTGEQWVPPAQVKDGEFLELDSLELLDQTVASSDSAEVRKLKLAEERARLAVPAPKLDTLIQVVDIQSFAPYFLALDSLKADPTRSVRVIHYGDSQLEGDRITMNLRDKLQKSYGGSGFGYVALSPLVAPSSLDFKRVEGLSRKTVFGRRDTSIHDGLYGHLASFSLVEHRTDDTTQFGAVVDFERRNWGYRLARNFKTVRMSLQAKAPLSAEIWVADTLFSTRIFPAGSWSLALDVPPVEAFTLQLGSTASARVFGISFESPTGIQVDNVAMRGASGMMFRKIDAAQLQGDLQREQYKLIIMQFGGNAVPYLKDEAHAQRFARAAGRQVAYIQRLYPDAAILYIGPSDMARKQGLNMESYPLIPALKLALRNEMLSLGAGYWDLYDVMGGEGSMVQWVDAEPALAVKDYIHFTPKGASWVGKRLAAALEILQQQFNKAREEMLQEQAAAMQQSTGEKTDTVHE